MKANAEIIKGTKIKSEGLLIYFLTKRRLLRGFFFKVAQKNIKSRRVAHRISVSRIIPTRKHLFQVRAPKFTFPISVIEYTYELCCHSLYPS